MNLLPALDLFPLLAALLAAILCALLGNYLVVRKMSLMGDAISHGVLPGLVIAFLITGTRAPLAMFLGAAAAGLATALLVETVRRVGRIEAGAAMGVVFSVFFALGVLLIERAAAQQVDLDADCILHGQLETLVWFEAPATWGELSLLQVLDAAPRAVTILLVALALVAALVSALWKELRLAAFDPGFAASLGLRPALLDLLLMVMVAVATVAAFEAVGSILVIAMLIVPASTARMLTDRFGNQVLFSLMIAALTAFLGYAAATVVPASLGYESVNAAGSIVVVGGLLLAMTLVFAPRHGWLGRRARQRKLAANITLDDMLGALYRREERKEDPPTVSQLGELLLRPRWRAALSRAESRGWVRRHGSLPLTTSPAFGPLRPRDASLGQRRALLGRLTTVHPNVSDAPRPAKASGSWVQLTPEGRATAAALVRAHRLWEAYLVDRAGVSPDQVHSPADLLEHLEITPLRGPAEDPHGRPIPTPPRPPIP